MLKRLDDFVQSDHSLRAIREMVYKALVAIDDAVWFAPDLSKNSQRLFEHDTVLELFNQTVAQADVRQLLSGEHCSL